MRGQLVYLNHRQEIGPVHAIEQLQASNVGDLTDVILGPPYISLVHPDMTGFTKSARITVKRRVKLPDARLINNSDLQSITMCFKQGHPPQQRNGYRHHTASKL